MTICRCAKSILNKTAHSFSVTFDKDKAKDAVIWVAEDGEYEPDDLIDVEWSEARNVLPMPQQLEALMAERPHGLLYYEKEVMSWSG